MLVDGGTDFNWFFLSADDFIDEAPKLKLSLTDPLIFRFFFVIIGASSDSRPMIGRLFEENYIMISANGRPIIGCQSPDDCLTVDRGHFIKDPSADRHRNRSSCSRWLPDFRLIIDFALCYIVYNAGFLIIYVILGFISIDIVSK